MAFDTLHLKNPVTGESLRAPVGFSWTTLFFGFFVPLCRADWLKALLIILVALLTFGLSNIVFAFIYNKLYIKDLIYARGFKVVRSDKGRLDIISQRLNVELPMIEGADSFGKAGPSSMVVDQSSITEDAYKVYLVEKYGIKKNEVLNKFYAKDRLFDDIEGALNYCRELEGTDNTGFQSIPGSKWRYRVLDDGALEVMNQYGGLRAYPSIESAKAELTWWK